MKYKLQIMAVCKIVCRNNIYWDDIVALIFDKCLGTARCLRVKFKASSNAFLYISLSPPSFLHKALVLGRITIQR